MYLQEMLDDQYSESLFTKLAQYGLEDNEIIIKSMRFAKFYHKGQNRKSGEPYYMHPVAVALMILPYTIHPRIIASALMHDVVEDTIATIGLVLDNFGWRIAEIVDRLTRDRPDGSKLSVLEILEDAYQSKDNSVLLVKLFDKMHNLYTCQYIEEKKQIKLAQEVLEETLVIAAHLGYIDIEKELYMICDKILNPKGANKQKNKYNYVS